MTVPKQLVFFETWCDPAAQELLTTRPDVNVQCLHYADPPQENWMQLARAHGYQISTRGDLREPWFGDAALLARCPSLLAIASTGAGYDMIDTEACTQVGVLVCNQSGSNFEAVAEHAIAAILMLSKKIAIVNRALRRGDAMDRWSYCGNDIQSKVVGIVGIGHIGRRVAQLCTAFGMEVLAFDPYLGAEEIGRRGARKVELAELLRRSDFVTVHCPRTAETMNLFGAAEFAAMKKGAHYINTARGGTYDEEALLHALNGGQVAGAAIDVFLQEPPATDHPLLQHESVIATPHLAGLTRESLRNMAQGAAQQWIKIFDGEVPERLVNPAAWPLYSERFARLMGRKPREPGA